MLVFPVRERRLRPFRAAGTCWRLKFLAIFGLLPDGVTGKQAARHAQVVSASHLLHKTNPAMPEGEEASPGNKIRLAPTSTSLFTFCSSYPLFRLVLCTRYNGFSFAEKCRGRFLRFIRGQYFPMTVRFVTQFKIPYIFHLHFRNGFFRISNGVS